MHWLASAAVRAGIKGAGSVLLQPGTQPLAAWESIARAGGVSPTELASKVAGILNLTRASVSAADPGSARLVPEKLARRYGVFPLRDDDRHLVVATSDPNDLECEQALGFAAGRRVRFELAPPGVIAQAIDQGYRSEQSMDAVLARAESPALEEVDIVAEEYPEPVAIQEIESGPVVRLTNLILRDAVRAHASDIHIEPGDGGGTVRFRVDGVMRQHMQMPTMALNRVVSRIKVMGALDIADRIRPQDGRARLKIEAHTYDLRISTIPVREAEKAVIRVLRPDAALSLEGIGIAASELERLRALLSRRDGIVLVTGPTGSGKTTTLYGALREVVRRDVNITTVEDPIEYELPGIAQIQVDPRRGVTFASALRAVLRQDPDVILVGEIRDLETAEIAVQAAMTGHLVLATLHTNDAVSAVLRLLDLGLDRAALANTVRGSLAQRLVRRICASCAVPVSEPDAEESRLARAFGVRQPVRAPGCEQCGFTGYAGRLPVVEVALVDPAMADQITRDASLAALQQLAVTHGMRTLRDAALERVTAGETTLAEVERVIGDAGSGEKRRSTDPMVVVADDDPIQRLVVTTALQKAAFRVAPAEDGAVALRHIRSGGECALVVTDMQMPNLDGAGLLRALREDPRTALLPVIVVTGSAEEGREAEMIDAGADDYVHKPVEPHLLVARVRGALRRAMG